MLIAKLFLPLASPGLATIGLGAVGVVSGAYNVVEVVAIIVGLLVMAVAGIFTIRSNVAKIWREQAEGEKARNDDLTAQLQKANEERRKALADLDDCRQRSDQAPVLARLDAIDIQLKALAR